MTPSTPSPANSVLPPHMGKIGAMLVGTMILLSVAGLLAERVQPLVAPPVSGLTTAQQHRIEKIASASLFGQFRSSFSDFLWLKVDKYLHNGVDLRAMTPQERAAQKAAQVSSAKGENGFRAHHGDETTVIPSASHDWRGPIGKIEREIQPYANMENHTHRDPKEALPLFRLMTWSNPHFVPGYTVGASMIARDKSKYAEALAFLREGEKNNPESIEIKTQLGEMITNMEHKWDVARPYLEKAIALGDARDFKTLTDDESTDYEDAFRWLVLNRREAGDADGARRAAKAGLARFPDDVVCLNYLAGRHVPSALAAPVSPADGDGHDSDHNAH